MSKPKRGVFDPRNLRKIASAEDFQDEREPELRIGDLVRINSGGPIMLVVDIDGGLVTVSWKSSDGTQEWELPRPCVHRARDAW